MSSTPRYDDNLWTDRVLVYGENCTLVFIPRAKALELASIWKAALESKTWGELRQLMPPGAWNEFYAMLFNEDDDCSTLDSFREALKEADADVTEEDVLSQYRELDVGQRHPFDDDPFDWRDIPQLAEPTWPADPTREMLDWMPKPVQARYRKVGILEDGLELSASDVGAIVRDLESLGYTCMRNDRLIHQCFAFGF